jgi:hypothetical protein
LLVAGDLAELGQAACIQEENQIFLFFLFFIFFVLVAGDLVELRGAACT